MSAEKFEAWAIVELFGHQRVAGRLSDQAIGGDTFIRVDVPKGEGFYTRLFGKGAIYCINICEESVARNYAMDLGEPLRPYAALPAPSPPVETTQELAARLDVPTRDGAPAPDRDDDDYDDDPPY